MRTTTVGDDRQSAPGHPGSEVSTAPDAALLRIGATAALLGLAVQVVMDRLHPHRVHPNDTVAVFREYARSSIWTQVHIGQFLGVLLIVVALLALTRHLARQPGLVGGLAVLGAATAVVTLAIFAVQMAVDGVALKAAIDGWITAAGPDRVSAFQVADGIRATEKGLGGFFQLMNGLTLLLVGVSVTVAAGWPRWLGWFGATGGLAFVAGGVLTATTGFSTQASRALLAALLLSLVFVIGSAVAMWRRASAGFAVPPR